MADEPKKDDIKTQSDASSEDKAVNVSQQAAQNAPQAPAYSKEYLIASGAFNFLDRTILDEIVDDNTKLSVDEAKQQIKAYKGAE